MKNIFKLNIFSWLLLIAFFLVVFVAKANSRATYEGFIITTPLIVTMVFLSELSGRLVTFPYLKLSPQQLFQRDIFLINYTFLFGGMIGVIIDHDNVDLNAWWALFLYLITFYGFVFSLLFIFVEQILKYSNTLYNFIYCLIILLILISLRLFPSSIEIALIGRTDTLLIVLFLMLSVHFTLIAFLKFAQLHGKA